ncbi:hypothetical protein J8J40_24355, partial [Mycobacterium tuberculosis]|nr:hypothetical protein [Mycobacterium tuberculosis]
LQLANIHSEGRCQVFHNDWIHPDGCQVYRGPSKFYLERCDFVSNGGNGFIGQPNTVSGLQNLYDWWYQDVHFRAERQADAHTRRDDAPPAANYTNSSTSEQPLITDHIPSFHRPL